MIIYIMRHGHALPAGAAGVRTDAERPLSNDGRAEARAAAALLAERSAKPGLILASPLLRAQQTTQEVAGLLKPRPEVRIYDHLENLISGMDLYHRIVEDDLGHEEILIVGHMPQLGDLASHLTGHYFTLQPAGLIALKTSGNGSASVLWASNPDER